MRTVSGIAIPSLTISLLQNLLALFAKNPEKFCDQVQRILGKLHDAKEFSGLAFEGEEISVGSLRNIKGLPEMWQLREFLRDLSISIADQEKILGEAIATARKNADAHFLATLCKKKTRTNKREEELHASRVTAAEKALSDFKGKTKAFRDMNRLVNNTFWEYVKTYFPGLNGHKENFGIFGGDLLVCWVKRAA